MSVFRSILSANAATGFVVALAHLDAPVVWQNAQIVVTVRT